MDREQAMFILRSFRPDGADAADPDFAEALALAHQDRELGEWLARERADDAAFSRAILSMNLPDSLREDILQRLSFNQGDFPQVEDPVDAMLVGAMASIQPPPGLRGEILAAMNRTVPVKKKSGSLFRRLALPLAAAAGVALAFLSTQQWKAEKVKFAGNGNLLTVNRVQEGFIDTYGSPLFRLDLKRKDHQQIFKHLKDHSLPYPANLPPGLAGVDGIGCRELIIEGRHGSLICFNESEAGVVHLVIFQRKDVSCELPTKEHPEMITSGRWAGARWADDEAVFILMGRTEQAKISALF